MVKKMGYALVDIKRHMSKPWVMWAGGIVTCLSLFCLIVWTTMPFTEDREISRSQRSVPTISSRECDGPGLLEGLVYGDKGYMNLDNMIVDQLSSVPLFGEKPRLISAMACEEDEVDPVAAGCIWVLASPPHFNPTLSPIPESSPLRKFGKYLGIARPPSEKLPKNLDVPILDNWRDGVGGFVQEEEGPMPPTAMLFADDLRLVAVTKLFDKVHTGHQSDSRLFRFGDEWWVHFRADCLERGPEVWSPPAGIDCDSSNGWVGEHRKQRAVLMRMVPEVWGMQDKVGLIAQVDPTSLVPLVGPLAGKNQAFFQYGEGDDIRRFVLAWFNPTTVHEMQENGSIDQNTIPGSSIPHPALPPADVIHLNGGQLVYIPETNEFLGVGHHIYRHPEGYRLYNIHFFFTLDGQPPFSMARISTEFCVESTPKAGDCEKRQFFMGMLVEYRGGEGLEHARLIMPYGVNNYEAKVVAVPLSDVLSMLRPISEL